jgi:hypothetical protein
MPDDFKYDVFLSHSSKDKAVVRDVAERLRADGLRVWFDEWEIKAGDDVPLKINTGLEYSRAIALFMSAQAFGSEWATLESITFGFRDSMNRERRFIPLRLDDAPIKDALRPFHYIDWRPEVREEEYPKLLEACRPPARLEMGKLYGVGENVPANYIRRENELTAIKQDLLNPMGFGRKKIVGICGPGGIGKTTLAAALARDEEVRRTFSDGIFYFFIRSITIEEQLRIVLAESFGPEVISAPMDRLPEILSGRKLLIIIDEIGSESENISTIRSVTAFAQVLIVTQDETYLSHLGASVHRIGNLSNEEALEFLARYAGLSSTNELPVSAQRLLEASENSPLNLAMIGAAIREKSSTILGEILESSGGAGDSPDSPAVATRHILDATIELLTEEERDHFLELAGFEDPVIPLGAVGSLWDLSDEDTVSLLTKLSSHSLIAFNAENETIHLQKLIADYLAEKRPNARPVDTKALLRSRQILVSLSSDSDDGEDRLSIKAEVEAFSSVLASKNLLPPLCLGIFGDWGSGKSFFMRKMQARIDQLCAHSIAAEERQDQTAFYSRIAQITFNAWHYVDANLWASMACRIFEGLDHFISISDPSNDPKVIKAQLFKQLETAREKLEEAESVSEAAKKEVIAVEKKMEKLERLRREKTLKLENMRSEMIKKLFTENEEVRKRLEEAAEQVGLEQLAGNVKELEEVLRGFRTISGRIQALCLAIIYGKDRWWRIGFLVGIIALIPLMGIGLEKLLAYLNATGAIGSLTAILTQLGAVVAAISAWLTKNLRWATGIVKKVDDAREEADTLIREARAKPTPEEAQLQMELTSLKQKEASAQTALKEAQEKAQQAEKEKQELEDRANGKVLAEFIREKVSGSTYQGQLGIVSTLRKDLQALNDLLAKAKEFREQTTPPEEKESEKYQNLPRIDRIILYIDDLDRCPEKTVVEVLQAVHLLLAFPIFIVVIGVDSRWLLRSLRHHYTALRMFEDGADSQAFGGAMHFSSTPQNYLEKIIQVPFNLRRMDSRGFQRLIEDILPFKRENDGATAQSGEITIPSVSSPEQATDAPTGVTEIRKETKEEPRPGSEEAEQRRRPSHAGNFDLAPESLIVTQKEVEFMAELVSLIPTPRAAKRLGNIYRLIRAGVSRGQLKKFLGCHQMDGEYRTVMSLLAIQVGFPLVANELFARIRLNPTQSWEEIHAVLVAADDSLERNGLRMIDHQHDPSAAWSRERARLAACLKSLITGQKIVGAPNTYSRWVDRVNRYSFRSVEQELAESDNIPAGLHQGARVLQDKGALKLDNESKERALDGSARLSKARERRRQETSEADRLRG